MLLDALEHLLNPDPKSSSMSMLDILQKNDWIPRQPQPLTQKKNATSIQRLEVSQPSTQPPIALSTLMKQVFGTLLDIPHRTITPLETSTALRTAMTGYEDQLDQEPLAYSDSFFLHSESTFGEISASAASMSLEEPDVPSPQEPRANAQEPDQGHIHVDAHAHGSGATGINTTLVMAVHPVPVHIYEPPHRLATFDAALAAFVNSSRHEEDAVHHGTIQESISHSDRAARYSSWNNEFGSTRVGQDTYVPRSVTNTRHELESSIDPSLRHPFEARSSYRRVEPVREKKGLVALSSILVLRTSIH